jgi:hypothetical protein
MQPIGSTVFFNFILAPSTSRRFKFHERGQLSLACITKRFLSPRCASAIQIVRRYSVNPARRYAENAEDLRTTDYSDVTDWGAQASSLVVSAGQAKTTQQIRLEGAPPQREEHSAPPVFSQAGRARIERSGFPAECYCDCVGGLSPTA